MNEIARYGLILCVICLVAAGLLAGVHALTKAHILAQAQTEAEGGLSEVMPEAASFQPVKKGEEVAYYQALDQKGQRLGVVFKAAAKGYSSTIETLVGMFADGTISAIKVVSQNETPGLGSRVGESDFTRRFAQKNIEQLNEVQAITGATISSAAVIKSVQARAEEVKALLQDGK
jgi:electron transport complex protein RnfG